MNLENIITRVSDFIKRYRNTNCTISFTLGKYTTEFGFEKNLFQAEKYQCILDLLSNCSTWDSTDVNTTERFKSTPLRVVDKLIITCENGPYDIIVEASSIEGLVYVSDDYICQENVFKRKNHTFKVSKNSTSLDETFYTASVIADIPRDFTDTYIAHSSLLKITDLVRVCGAKEILSFAIV